MEMLTGEQALNVGLKIDLFGGATVLVRDVEQAVLVARLLKSLAVASSC